MTNATAVVRPLPGSGLAARAGDLLLVCADGGDEVDDLLGLVTEVAAAGGDGGVLVRRVAALLAADFDGMFPACAASGPTRDGRLAVLVYGAAVADVVSGEGDFSLAGSDGITSVNRLISGPITAIRLQLPGAGPANPRSRLDSGVISAAGLLYSAGSGGPVPLWAGPPEHEPPQYEPPQYGAPSYEAPQYEAPVSSFGWEPPPQAGSSYGVALPDEYSVGTASASSSMMDNSPRAAEPAPDWSAQPASQPAPDWSAQPAMPAPISPVPPAMPAPVPPVPPAPANAPASVAPQLRQPDPAAPFVAVLLVGGVEGVEVDEPPAPEIDPRPKVLGVLCENDHFNDPSLRYCSVCGISMAYQSLVKHEALRPPLGVLLLDDASVFRLDLDYIVGREPQTDPEVISGTVRPLRIADADGVVSRRHLRVALVGWDVQVVDLGSANGTYLTLPGDQQRHQLAPNQPVVIRPGTQVTMGRRWLRYESHRNP